MALKYNARTCQGSVTHLSASLGMALKKVPSSLQTYMQSYISTDCAAGEHCGFRYKEGLTEAWRGVNTL